jgi:penicillin-binding protein 1A
MPDLGSQLRDYYELVVERVDPDQVRRATPNRTGWARGLLVAGMAAAVTILVLGLVWLVRPDDSDPAELPPPSSVVPTTTGGESSEEILPPTVFVLADGTEIILITETGPATSLSGFEGLSEFVLRQLASDTRYWSDDTTGAEALGLDPNQRTGLTVELTIAPEVQEVVESVIDEWHDDPETFISVVVVDNTTGEILAAAPGFGGSDNRFFPEQQIPVGSLAQVYTTVAALEAGIPIDSAWDGSSPQTFTLSDGSQWTVRGINSESVTLGEALYRAVNTVFGGVAVEVGADAIIDAAHRLGVDIRGADLVTPPEAVAVGEGTINTFDAAAMFATLSRQGTRTQPNMIRSITNSSGLVIYQESSTTQVGVDPDAVEVVRQPLSDVPYIGTAASALRDFNSALNPIGKDGTAEDHRAAWYVGSTDRYTVAVAVGRHDGAPLQDVIFNGQSYSRVFGGSVPAPIWEQILNQLSEDL